MRLNEAYEKFNDKMDFYAVYIAEAHPTDGWVSLKNEDEGIRYKQPKTTEERAEIAEICVLDIKLKMPALLTDISDTVSDDYAALPLRIFVIDRDGVVAYRTERGPRDMDMDAAMKAIEEQALETA